MSEDPAAISRLEAKRADLSRSVLFAHAAPALASSFLFTALSLDLLEYSTDVLLMAPATMGLLFGISRFWDALTDPLVVGHLSDRTNTRWSRRRPWLVASAFPVGLTCLAMWAPPEGFAGISLTLWMGASIIGFYFAITVFSVADEGVHAEIRQKILQRRASAASLEAVPSASSGAWPTALRPSRWENES